MQFARAGKAKTNTGGFGGGTLWLCLTKKNSFCFITPGYVTVQFSGVAENLPLWTVDGNNCEKSDAEI